MQLDDTVSAVVLYAFYGGDYYFHCNDMFSENFSTMEDMSYRLLHTGVLPEVLIAR